MQSEASGSELSPACFLRARVRQRRSSAVRSGFPSGRELCAVTQLWPSSHVRTLAAKVSEDSNVCSANYSSSWVNLFKIKGESKRYVWVKCHTISDYFLWLEILCFITVSTEHGWDAKSILKINNMPIQVFDTKPSPKKNPFGFGLQSEN